MPGSGQRTLTLNAVRGGYVMVAGAGGNVNQALALAVTVAPKCTYSLSPASVEWPPAAASHTVALTATNGCRWAACSNASRIALNRRFEFRGGQVAYSLAANIGAARTGTLTIAGDVRGDARGSGSYADPRGIAGGRKTAALPRRVCD